MQTPRKYASGQALRLSGSMLILAILTTSCGVSMPSGTTETMAAFCRELIREKPTYAAGDTAASKAQGIRALTVIKTNCE